MKSLIQIPVNSCISNLRLKVIYLLFAGFCFFMNENSTSFVSSDAKRFGRIGEHLVCADLLLSGFEAYMVYDRPYDLIVESGSKLYKVQIKTTYQARYAYQKSKTQKRVYSFNVHRNGYRRGNAYKQGDVDLFALVALDSKYIAYMPFSNRAGNILFRDPKLKGTYSNERGFELCPKIQELKEHGFKPSQIIKELGISYDLYYAHYKAKSGLCKGYYIDNFPFKKCLSFIEKNTEYSGKDILLNYLYT